MPDPIILGEEGGGTMAVQWEEGWRIKVGVFGSNFPRHTNPESLSLPAVTAPAQYGAVMGRAPQIWHWHCDTEEYKIF